MSEDDCRSLLCLQQNFTKMLKPQVQAVVTASCLLLIILIIICTVVIIIIIIIIITKYLPCIPLGETSVSLAPHSFRNPIC